MTAEEKAELDRWTKGLPVDDEDLSPEQEAEYAAILAKYDAGTLSMVPHEDVPAFLEQMARDRARAA